MPKAARSSGFENDVKAKGTKPKGETGATGETFENDVKVKGTKPRHSSSCLIMGLRMM